MIKLGDLDLNSIDSHFPVFVQSFLKVTVAAGNLFYIDVYSHG